MKKREVKEFAIVFVKENNQYGLAFKNDGCWLAQSLFSVDDPSKETCLISENVLWKMNDLHVLGHSFIGIVRVDTEKEFWNISEKLG